MTQPFRNGLPASFRTPDWPELVFRYDTDRITTGGAGMLQVLSSAILGGGRREADTFINRKVPLDYAAERPDDEMRRHLIETGYDPARTVGLLTAAKLTHASIVSDTADGCRLAAAVTAGTRNAARAGTFRLTFPPYRPGTINTLIFVDGRMTEAAMVNAVITATEAKAAALADAGIREEFAPELTATGTTTDVVVVAATGSMIDGAIHEYAGSASTLGNAIGRLVYAAVLESVRTQHEP